MGERGRETERQRERERESERERERDNWNKIISRQRQAWKGYNEL